MIARLALAAALLGSAAGATAVLAAGDEPPRKPKPPAIAALATPAQPTPEPMKAQNAKLLVEVADPDGGVPWAIRHFTGQLEPRKPPKDMRKYLSPDALEDLEATSTDCWELGRLQGDQFGWIDGHGTFTARAPGRYELPMSCYTARSLRRIGPALMRSTTIAYTPGRSPEPSRTITWGPVSDEVAAVTPENEARISIGPERAVLQIARGGSAPLRRGVIERRDGSTKRFDFFQFPRQRGERPVAGTERVAVRAPDPAGGEPWGVVVKDGTKGGLCFDTPGRLVGNQVGFVDQRHDTFMPGFEFEVACNRERPTRSYPLRLDTLISSIPEGDDRGEVERRVLSHRIVFWGRAHPDVVSVTIKTPRDVRTLIPSVDLHFVMAVYDGQFPAGKATATARLRDGKEVTRSLYVE